MKLRVHGFKPTIATALLVVVASTFLVTFGSPHDDGIAAQSPADGDIANVVPSTPNVSVTLLHCLSVCMDIRKSKTKD